MKAHRRKNGTSAMQFIIQVLPEYLDSYTGEIYWKEILEDYPEKSKYVYIVKKLVESQKEK